MKNQYFAIILILLLAQCQPNEKNREAVENGDFYAKMAEKHHNNYEFEKAIDYYQKAIDFWQDTLQYQKQIIENRHYQADAYGDLGDYARRLEKMYPLLAYCKKNNDLEYYWYVHQLIGVTYQTIGLLDSAKQYAENNLNYYLSQKLNTDNKRMLAANYNNLGMLYRDGGFKSLDTSVLYLKKSLALYTELNQQHHVANSTIELGKTYYKAYRYTEALIWLNKAKEIWLKSQYPFRVWEANYHLGEWHRLQNQKQKALEYYKLAADSIFLSQPQLAWQVQKSRALCLTTCVPLSKTDSFAAFAVYQKADTLLQTIRKKLRNDAAHYFWNGEAAESYTQALDLSIALFESTNTTATEKDSFKNAAFHFARRQKSPVLLSAMDTENALRHANLGQPDYDSIYQIRSKIAQTRNQLDINPNSDSLLTTLTHYYTEEEKFEKYLEKKYPNYQKLIESEKTSPSVADLQKGLDDSTLAVSYILSPKTLYCLAWSKHTTKMYRTPINQSFYLDLAAYRAFQDNDSIAQIHNRDSMIAAAERYSNHGYRLFQKLLQQQLNDFKSEKLTRLSILPDGNLAVISWAALPTSADYRWHDNKYKRKIMLYEMATSFAFTDSLVNKSIYKKSPYNRSNFGGFAISWADSNMRKRIENDPSNAVSNPNVRGGKLAELKNAKREVKEGLKNLITGNIWLDNSATKSAFTKQAANYRIFHITTHYDLNPHFSSQSALLFYPDTSKKPDYRLTNADIYGLHTHADLAILSTCNSGFSTYQKGEGGVFSLARAFAYSGTSAILMSNWELSDRTTTPITDSFYKYLKQGLTKDQALRLAQIDYLENSINDSKSAQQPFNWAALALIGDRSPVFKTDFSNQWLALVLIVGSLLVVIWWLRRMTRH